MADQENQTIEAQEAENSTVHVENSSNGENNSSYWCYQCNKEVSLEPHEGESEMVCSECHNGFVEAVATAQGFPYDRRANRRPRRQRSGNAERVYSNQRNVLRVLRLFERVAQANPRIQAVIARDGIGGERRGTNVDGRVNSQDGSFGNTRPELGHPLVEFVDRETNLGHPQGASVNNETSLGHPRDQRVDNQPILRPPQAISGNDVSNSGHPQAASIGNQLNSGHLQAVADDNLTSPGHPQHVSANSQPNSGPPQLVASDNQQTLGLSPTDSSDNQPTPQTEFSDNQPNSDQSQAVGVAEDRDNAMIEFLEEENVGEDDDNILDIELDMWDSFQYDDEDDDDGDEEDEEENDAWEEVDEGDAAEGQDEEPVEVGSILNSGENNAEINEAEVDGQRRSNTRRDVLRLRIVRDGNSQSPGAFLETSGRTLDWREIMQGLEDNTIELRLSLPEEDTYVGNPADYVDDAGYEILLQNFAENDNGHRGAPPAAKSAIESLPSFAIRQVDIDSGAAMCAICKDIISLGETGKKLPCQHLYHGDCIVPWLSSRNSCPICRYELPTDDVDYEEQKKQRIAGQSTVSDSSMVLPERDLS